MKTRIACAAALSAAVFSAPAHAQQSVLRFNSWLPATHPITVLTLKPWMEQVAKATDGRVRFEFTASGLGPPPTQLDMVKDGVVDAAITVHGFTPARFPLMQLGELPFLSKLSEPLSVAMWRVTQKHFAARNEHGGTQLLTVWASQPGLVWSAKPAMRTPKDWEGVKLGGVSSITLDISKALGAVPVRAPGPAQAVEMLKRGTVDAVYLDTSSFLDFNMAGTVRYVLDFPKGMYASTLPLMINQAKWNAISAADRAAIEKLSGEPLSRTAGRNWDGEAAKARQAIPGSGAEFIPVDGAVFRAYEDRLRFLEEQWVQKANAVGVDGRAALAELKDIIAKYTK
jgi:TRAP-type C4-dicarboxylate transport system substrate-binding protein